MTHLFVLLLAACGGGNSTGTDANLPPSAPVVAINPAEPSVIDNLVVEVIEASVDPEGDPVTYAYRWYVDGELREDQVGSSVPWTVTEDGQTWSVEVVPSDPWQEGPPGTAEVLVTNQPPEVELVVPAEVTTDEDVVAQVSAVDPEGANVAVRVAWTLDGGTATWEGDTLPASETDVLDTWLVEAWVDDGGGEVLGATGQVEVVNRPPEIVSLAFSPSPYVEGSDVTVIAEADDPDGEPVTLTYDFELDGVAIQSGPDDTVPAALLAGGSTLVVEAVANDGHEDGPPASATLLLDADPPVIDSVSLDPSPVPDNRDLSARVSVTDPTGGWTALEFTWKVNGSVVLTGDFPNLHSSFFEEGDTVEVEVVADNGVATSLPETAGPVTVSPAMVSSTFDLWGFSFYQVEFGVQAGLLDPVYTDASDPTSEVGPRVVARFYNTDWQLTYDLSDTCDMELAIVGSAPDTSWEASLAGGWWLTLVPTGADLSRVDPSVYAGPCDSLDPAIWGDYTPVLLFDPTYYTWAVGVAAPSSDFADSIESVISSGGGAYGDWTTEWEPYLESVWWAFASGGSVTAFELDYGFTYEVSGGEIVTTGAGTSVVHGSLVPLPFDGSSLPDGYQLHWAWYLLTFS